MSNFNFQLPERSKEYRIFSIFLRANYVITPKKFIMRVRENKCQITPNDTLHNIFRILPVFSQFLSNLTFILSGSHEK